MSRPEEFGSKARDIVPLPQQGGEQSDAVQERANAAPRFVVYGPRISGAYGAARAFEDHLAKIGFENAEVGAERDAAFIKEAFYGPDRANANLALESSEPVPMWRRVANMILRREAEAVPEESAKDLPAGVVVFPQMRQYTSTGSGMFIPAPREHIQELCDKEGVPVIFVEDIETAEDFEIAMERFAIEPPEEQ